MYYLRKIYLILFVSFFAVTLTASSVKCGEKWAVIFAPTIILSALGLLGGLITGIVVSEKSVPSDHSKIDSEPARGWLDILVGLKYGAILSGIGAVLGTLSVAFWQSAVFVVVRCLKCQRGNVGTSPI